MKRLFMTTAIAALTTSTLTFAADVGVSISIGQPGFYGRLDIGDYPRPRLIYAQPIIVDRGVRIHEEPIYLRVPPGHAKHWSKHCHEYNACGERVYFVHDDWYENEYVPRYQERHRDYREDRQDQYRDNDHGNQKHEGKGHGHEH